MTDTRVHPASFKDPSGFVFEASGILYRQVNRCYASEYDRFMHSGLYNELVEKNWLVAHREVDGPASGTGEPYKILSPDFIYPLSFATEWSFEQLLDAAMLTLSVLRCGVDHGMILKDATPFNIQFREGKPVFIDTLSFETHIPEKPWVAYRPFCENFLFPLLLQHFTGIPAGRWLAMYPEGIPVDETARLLPFRSRFHLACWLHVYLQRSVKKYASNNKPVPAFSKNKLLNLVDHLMSVLKKLRPGRKEGSAWSNYYEETILGKEYLAEKEKIFRRLSAFIRDDVILDLGANDGYFSKIMAVENRLVVATDSDETCIARLYRQCRDENIRRILPLVVDIAQPAPATGFRNRERASFLERIKPGYILALALVHHLVIGRNIGLDMLASFFRDTAPGLIVEFVPKSDPKVRMLLEGREDIFSWYSTENFERIFSRYFQILDKMAITGSDRILYRMQARTT